MPDPQVRGFSSRADQDWRTGAVGPAGAGIHLDHSVTRHEVGPAGAGVGPSISSPTKHRRVGPQVRACSRLDAQHLVMGRATCRCRMHHARMRADWAMARLPAGVGMDRRKSWQTGSSGPAGAGMDRTRGCSTGTSSQHPVGAGMFPIRTVAFDLCDAQSRRCGRSPCPWSARSAMSHSPQMRACTGLPPLPVLRQRQPRRCGLLPIETLVHHAHDVSSAGADVLRP